MSERATRVWDAPTRIVHWLLVALIAFSWWSAESGELQLHRYSGYTLFAVLVFRIYWMFVGGETARLWRYLRGPRIVSSYARALFAAPNQAAPAPGHNPLGAWSALLLLVLLGAQITLGLFAVDVDGIESGPLSHLVSFDAGRFIAEQHELLFNVLLAFIALHVAAVVFYLLVRRENLVTPMVTGASARSSEAPRFIGGSRRMLPGLALAALAAWAISAGFWL